MSFSPFSITVPGTTANLGPGFDSIGMAFNRYLRLNVLPSEKTEYHFSGQINKPLPLENNLVHTAAETIAKRHGMELPPFLAEMDSELPLAKGLGSSAAAIAAGIELADQVLKFNLSLHEKLTEACLLEGHPDNVVPAFTGGIMISHFSDGELITLQAPPPRVELVMAMPFQEWATKESRNALPDHLDFGKAVRAGSCSSILVASLYKGDWQTACRVMEKDLYHEPYRAPFISEYSAVKDAAAALGAYGGAISGAGPSIVIFTEPQTGKKLAHALQEKFQQYEFEVLLPDLEGTKISQLTLK
ncbi:homoserine kinase [Fictibacillus aquaticus]|nr:homoserine kinase [Fictibacillus aquaticus]